MFHFFIFIVVLDGRGINQLTRQFLINWKAFKEAKKKKNNGDMMTGQLSPYPLTSKIFLKSTVTSFPMLSQLFPNYNLWDQLYLNKSTFNF